MGVKHVEGEDWDDGEVEEVTQFTPPGVKAEDWARWLKYLYPKVEEGADHGEAEQEANQEDPAREEGV